ncbi:RNA-binding protein MEX3B [Lutzomyia longipalpis]|uniref:Putative rna-binding protein mex3b microplitis demolitor n=1 Tax=Lutzomyia longipalpis TaxID=7200 RepID=A0A1B0CKK8_LUTLO|nr:RNA-binding protein MEX3B [Lutzomyia longipalpis]
MLEMSSLFGDLSDGVVDTSSNLEDQRALQLAFELSMLGLSESFAAAPDSTTIPQASPSPPANAFAAAFQLPPPGLDERFKKSQNMTECVPVPSSEHVAEIVGRQGCKIKALRAKTNTYIKTPVRGEEPVFVVTGRKEDVAKAKREILSAAEHFSLIRASRKPTIVGGAKAPLGPAINIPGHVTIQVRVPYRVVGLVVGPKGATIKHIQQQTHTYIVTPSRDKEPVFEVTGLPDSVQAARHQIEAHIALRTGQTSGSLSGLGQLLGDDTASPELLASLYKNGLGSLFGYLDGQGQTVDTSTSNSSAASTASSKSGQMTRPELINIWKNLSSGESIDFDEGLGESPSIWSMQPSSLLESRSSPSASASPTDSLLSGVPQQKRECLMCGDKEVTGALVPCGHNMFCLECANRICAPGDALCPVCSQVVSQAIRIIA